MMAGKPSKWSASIEKQSMEEDDSFNHMSLDRETTRQHFELNEILTPEGKKYQDIIDNQNKLREFDEEPNPRGKTFRKVRGD
tara:strand:- start:112 stop:357 length:246 start_codon:yes stop_codon:yes gene_type:complete